MRPTTQNLKFITQLSAIDRFFTAYVNMECQSQIGAESWACDPDKMDSDSGDSEEDAWAGIPLEGNVCRFCRKKFVSPYKVKRHMKEVHGDKKYKCHLCSNTFFARKEKLERHVESVHVKYTKHKCSVCEQEFTRRDALNRHRNEVHRQTEKFNCPECPLSFSRKDTLDRHVRRDKHKK